MSSKDEESKEQRKEMSDKILTAYYQIASPNGYVKGGCNCRGCMDARVLDSLTPEELDEVHTRIEGRSQPVEVSQDLGPKVPCWFCKDLTRDHELCYLPSGQTAWCCLDCVKAHIDSQLPHCESCGQTGDLTLYNLRDSETLKSWLCPPCYHSWKSHLQDEGGLTVG